MSKFGVNVAAEQNQSEAVATKTKRESIIHTPEAAGGAVVRFNSYIEIGEQEDKYNPNSTKDTIMLGFEVVTPTHVYKGETKDGEEFTSSETLTLYVKKSFNKKGSLYNLFTRMAAGRPNITHFTQMLGEGFLVELFEQTDKDGNKLKNYKNTFVDGWNQVYKIGPPVRKELDEYGKEIGEKPLNVPPAYREQQCFVWNQPNEVQWESLQIGEYDDEHKDNFLKGNILNAVNYEGSPVEAMLLGAGEIGEEPAPEPEEEPVKKKPAKKKKPAAKKATQVEDDDPLAALGI